MPTSEHRKSLLEIDAEKTPVKMTPLRLALIIIGCVTITNLINGVLYDKVSKMELKEAIEVHNKHPHDVTGDGLESLGYQVAKLKTADAVHSAQLQRLEPLPDRVREIGTKVDILIESQRLSHPDTVRRAVDRMKARKGADLDVLTDEER